MADKIVAFLGLESVVNNQPWTIEIGRYDALGTVGLRSGENDSGYVGACRQKILPKAHETEACDTPSNLISKKDSTLVVEA